MLSCVLFVHAVRQKIVSGLREAFGCYGMGPFPKKRVPGLWSYEYMPPIYLANIAQGADGDVAKLENVPDSNERAARRLHRLHQQLLDKQDAKMRKHGFCDKRDKDNDNPDEMSTSNKSSKIQFTSEGSSNSLSNDADHSGKRHNNRRKSKLKPVEWSAKEL